MEVSSAHSSTLAGGVALDDYLGSDARDAVDTEARERYRAWRAQRAEALTLEGIELSQIWEVELVAQCFLPAARMRRALPAALAVTCARQLITYGLSPGMTELVAVLAEPSGVDVVAAPWSHPASDSIRRAPSALGKAALLLGVPPLVRGDVLGVAYWHLMPVFEALARSSRPRIVASPLPVRDMTSRDAVALALRGGWTGLPGAGARAASSATIGRRLRSLPQLATSDQLDAALDRHALEVLARISPDTLAHVRHARRALRPAKIRAALLPFDSAEQVRMLLPALRDVGATSLLVQHGFAGRLGDPDMQLADRLALWSERDRSLALAREPSTVAVTGNPGAAHLAGLAVSRATRRGCSVVLVDYPGRLSARVGSRVSMLHVIAALSALAAVRPGAGVVIRPHPSDLAPHSYLELASRHARLQVVVDVSSPIEDLLGSAGVCIGTLSTATLQACVLGVPTVFLDVSGISRPWPFNGEALPFATDSEALADELVAIAAGGEVPARDAALEALGVRGDAVERVLELLVEFSR